MMYYRYGELLVYSDQPLGYDKNREMEVGDSHIEFTKFREVYTSRNWMLRVYEVLEPENRAGQFKTPFDRKVLNIDEE